jgi:hypothetical protein
MFHPDCLSQHDTRQLECKTKGGQNLTALNLAKVDRIHGKDRWRGTMWSRPMQLEGFAEPVQLYELTA